MTHLFIREKLFSTLLLILISAYCTASGFDITFNLSESKGGYNIQCHGGNDGSIEAIPINDNRPFFYQWSNGATTKAISNLPAGVYTVTITDFTNTTATTTVELLEPSASVNLTLVPHVYDGGTNISKAGGNNGVTRNESVWGKYSLFFLME